MTSHDNVTCIWFGAWNELHNIGLERNAKQPQRRTFLSIKKKDILICDSWGTHKAIACAKFLNWETSKAIKATSFSCLIVLIIIPNFVQ